MTDATRSETREYVLRWISEERARYATVKQGAGTAGREITVESVRGDGQAIFDFIFSYVKRAQVLGLDNPLGRQALGKAAVTVLHTLETVVEELGPMPEPGYSSGEINEWQLDKESNG